MWRWRCNRMMPEGTIGGVRSWDSEQAGYPHYSNSKLKATWSHRRLSGQVCSQLIYNKIMYLLGSHWPPTMLWWWDRKEVNSHETRVVIGNKCGFPSPHRGHHFHQGGGDGIIYGGIIRQSTGTSAIVIPPHYNKQRYLWFVSITIQDKLGSQWKRSRTWY